MKRTPGETYIEWRQVPHPVIAVFPQQQLLAL
jgi:hypothetical protein